MYGFSYSNTINHHSFLSKFSKGLLASRNFNCYSNKNIFIFMKKVFNLYSKLGEFFGTFSNWDIWQLGHLVGGTFSRWDIWSGKF